MKLIEAKAKLVKAIQKAVDESGAPEGVEKIIAAIKARLELENFKTKFKDKNK